MSIKVYTFDEFIKESYLAEIFEQELSNISSKTVLVGSSKLDTTSKSAVNKLKNSIKDLVIDGDLTIEGALFRDSNKKPNREKNLYYNKKTGKEKDYIIIGDEKKTGDHGEIRSFDKTFREILDSNIEASGNGIYAFGRLLNLFRNKEIGLDDRIILVLNLKNPGGFIASVQSGFQNLEDSYASACLYTLISSGAIIPDKGNEQRQVKSFMEKKSPIDKFFANSAVPNIDMGTAEDVEQKQKDMIEKLRGKGSIDISKTLKEISGKKISEKGKDADGLVNKITDAHFEEFIKIASERYKDFLDIEAENAGIPKESFDNTKKLIDSWRESEIKKKKKYYERAKKYIDYAMMPTKEGSMDALSGVSASTKKIERKEGQI